MMYNLHTVIASCWKNLAKKKTAKNTQWTNIYFWGKICQNNGTKTNILNCSILQCRKQPFVVFQINKISQIQTKITIDMWYRYSERMMFRYVNLESNLSALHVCVRNSGNRGPAIALTIGSVPRRTVSEWRQFDRLFIFDNRWKWRNSGSILRGTDPTVSANGPQTLNWIFSRRMQIQIMIGVCDAATLSAAIEVAKASWKYLKRGRSGDPTQILSLR